MDKVTNLRDDKRREISWPPERLLVSQEGTLAMLSEDEMGGSVARNWKN